MSTAFVSIGAAQAEGVPPSAANFRLHWRLLGLMAGVYLALFIAFYPPTHGIEDEVGYLNQTIVWSRGAISAEGAGFDHLHEFASLQGRQVCWRNPGRSAWILPFYAVGGLHAVFLSGAVIHLLLTLTTGLTFARLGHSPLFAALVLCHPTLAIYSRTVMADSAAALGLGLALLAFVSMSRPGLACGLAVGMAACMRYQAGLALPFLALALLGARGSQRPMRRAAACVLAGGAIGLGLMGYNWVLYGNLTGWVNQGSFALHFIPRNLAFYAAALAAIWPLMLFSMLLDRSLARWANRAICLPLFALMLAWHAFDQHSSWLYTLVIGQRYLIPVLPAWIVAYGTVVDSLLVCRLFRFSPVLPQIAVVGSCLGLLLLLAAIFDRHQNHLLVLMAARDEVAHNIPPDSLVIGNYHLAKLFAVPSSELPVYRWRHYDYSGTPIDHAAELHAEKHPWYLAIYPKTPGGEHPEILRQYLARYRLTRIQTAHPGLMLYRAEGVLP